MSFEAVPCVIKNSEGVPVYGILLRQNQPQTIVVQQSSAVSNGSSQLVPATSTASSSGASSGPRTILPSSVKPALVQQPLLQPVFTGPGLQPAISSMQTSLPATPPMVQGPQMFGMATSSDCVVKSGSSFSHPNEMFISASKVQEYANSRQNSVETAQVVPQLTPTSANSQSSDVFSEPSRSQQQQNSTSCYQMHSTSVCDTQSHNNWTYSTADEPSTSGYHHQSQPVTTTTNGSTELTQLLEDIDTRDLAKLLAESESLLTTDFAAEGAETEACSSFMQQNQQETHMQSPSIGYSQSTSSVSQMQQQQPYQSHTYMVPMASQQQEAQRNSCRYQDHLNPSGRLRVGPVVSNQPQAASGPRPQLDWELGPNDQSGTPDSGIQSITGSPQAVVAHPAYSPAGSPPFVPNYTVNSTMPIASTSVDSAPSRAPNSGPSELMKSPNPEETTKKKVLTKKRTAKQKKDTQFSDMPRLYAQGGSKKTTQTSTNKVPLEEDRDLALRSPDVNITNKLSNMEEKFDKVSMQILSGVKGQTRSDPLAVSVLQPPAPKDPTATVQSPSSSQTSPLQEDPNELVEKVLVLPPEKLKLVSRLIDAKMKKEAQTRAAAARKRSRPRKPKMVPPQPVGKPSGHDESFSEYLSDTSSSVSTPSEQRSASRASTFVAADITKDPILQDLCKSQLSERSASRSSKKSSASSSCKPMHGMSIREKKMMEKLQTLRRRSHNIVDPSLIECVFGYAKTLESTHISDDLSIKQNECIKNPFAIPWNVIEDRKKALEERKKEAEELKKKLEEEEARKQEKKDALAARPIQNLEEEADSSDDERKLTIIEDKPTEENSVEIQDNPNAGRISMKIRLKGLKPTGSRDSSEGSKSVDRNALPIKKRLKSAALNSNLDASDRDHSKSPQLSDSSKKPKRKRRLPYPWDRKDRKRKTPVPEKCESPFDDMPKLDCAESTLPMQAEECCGPPVIDCIATLSPKLPDCTRNQKIAKIKLKKSRSGTVKPDTTKIRRCHFCRTWIRIETKDQHNKTVTCQQCLILSPRTRYQIAQELNAKAATSQGETTESPIIKKKLFEIYAAKSTEQKSSDSTKQSSPKTPETAKITETSEKPKERRSPKKKLVKCLENSAESTCAVPKRKFLKAGRFSKNNTLQTKNINVADLPSPPDSELEFNLPYDLWWEFKFVPKQLQSNPSCLFNTIRNNIIVDQPPTVEKSHACSCRLLKGVTTGACEDDCLNRMMFTECDNQCGCGDLCTNQAFQKHQWAPSLAKFNTESSRGIGLKTSEPLGKGSFVCEYVGEVISSDRFAERMHSWYAESLHHYALNLDSGYVIDSYRFGNLARFVNHSCDPNCEMQKWTVNGQYRMGIFALRPIQAGEELTYDYKFHSFRNQQDCQCGTAKCRRSIGGSRSSSTDSPPPTPNGFNPNSIRRLSQKERDTAQKHGWFLLRNYDKVRRIKRQLITEEGSKPLSKTKLDVAEYLSAVNSSRSVKTRRFSAGVVNEKILLLAQILQRIYTAVVDSLATDSQVSTCELKRQIKQRILAGDHYVSLQIFVDDMQRLLDTGAPSKTRQIYESAKQDSISQLKALGHHIPTDFVKESGINHVSIDSNVLITTRTDLSYLGHSPYSVDTWRNTDCINGVFPLKADQIDPKDSDKVRCGCAIFEEEGTMVQCDRCLFWLHAECVSPGAAVDDDFVCRFCQPASCSNGVTFSGSPKEGKTSGTASSSGGNAGVTESVFPAVDIIQTPQPDVRLRGCTYYRALVNSRGLQVRLNECVYVQKRIDEVQKEILKELHETCVEPLLSGEKSDKKRNQTSNGKKIKRHEKSATASVENLLQRDFSRHDLRVFRVERLFVGPHGRRFLFGSYYARPHETFCEPTRRFYRNELLNTPLYDTLLLDSAIGRCLVMDLSAFCRGRPRFPIYSDEDVYICELKVDKSQRFFEKNGAKNRYPINTQPYIFRPFGEKLKVRRDFTPFVMPSAESEPCAGEITKNSTANDEDMPLQSLRDQLQKQKRKEKMNNLEKVGDRLRKLQPK